MFNVGVVCRCCWLCFVVVDTGGHRLNLWSIMVPCFGVHPDGTSGLCFRHPE